jgi:membrane-associated protease RseP (regulator of RpoE activity)
LAAWRSVTVAALLAVAAFSRAEDPLRLLQNPPITDEEFDLPINPPTAAKIETLIAALGSPVFQERENATEELRTIGAPAFRNLRETYHGTEDFEVRSRIEAIVREAYVNHHLYDHFGFLGITQNFDTLSSDQDRRIPQGHVGIKIGNVLPGTGAARAGLQAGDVIVALDGEPLNGSGQRATQLFGSEIRKRGPGTIIVLSILRGEAELSFQATLGRPPTDGEPGDRTRVNYLPELTERVKQRFHFWWLKYFRRFAPETSHLSSRGN